jgi:hypothetical protein
MRATKAYLAGIGTTGILLACSLVLLTVGSALVAFQGWPGSAAGDRLQRVVVTNQAERAPAQSRQEPAAAARGDAADARRAARPAESSVKGVRRSSVRRAEDSRTAGPDPATGDSSGPVPESGQPGPGARDAQTSGGGGGGTRTKAPVSTPNLGDTVEQSTGGLSEAVEGTTGGLGDTVRDTTEDLGDAVEGVSPSLGETVSGTGDAAGQAVDETGQGVGQVVEDTGRAVNGLLP